KPVCSSQKRTYRACPDSFPSIVMPVVHSSLRALRPLAFLAPVDARSKFYRSRVPGLYDGSHELWLGCKKITRNHHPFSTRVSRTYKYLGSPAGPCKLLKVLESFVLKRLALAVRFRPEPQISYLAGWAI